MKRRTTSTGIAGALWVAVLTGLASGVDGGAAPTDNLLSRRGDVPAQARAGASGPTVAALITALGERDTSLRSQAARSLGAIGEPPGKIVPPLIKALGHPASGVRHHGEHSLRAIGLPARAALREVLASPAGQPQARVAAARALYRIEPAEALRVAPVVVDLLGAEDAEIRLAAAELVGEIGAATAAGVPGLQRLLGDPKADVRQTALIALGALGSFSAKVLPDIRRLLAEDDDKWVRLAAARSLGLVGRGDPTTIPALVEALSDKKDRVALAAATALGEMGTSAVPALVRALASPEQRVRAYAADAFTALGPRAAPAASALTRALGDADWIVRIRVAGALGAVGVTDEAVLGALRKASEADGNPAVRAHADSALRQLAR